MSYEGDMMGKMRTANTTVGAAAISLRAMYEEADEMLSPAKADELVRMIGEMEAALESLHPIIEEFAAIATRRKAHSLSGTA